VDSAGAVIDVRDACKPRAEVLKGGLEEKHFAAQLDQVVLAAPGYEAYADAEQFFALTYPTQGLNDLLASPFSRLNPAGGGHRRKLTLTRIKLSTATKPLSGEAKLTS